MMSVSYTHLDVYKRQGLSNRYLTKEDTSGRYDGIWKLVIPANRYGLINGGVSNDRIQQN